MKTAIVNLTSKSPLTFGKFHSTPKLDREQNDDYEKRTWSEKIHYDENEDVYIPPQALKNTLSEAAKFMSIQIPGKGKSTYTKHFESGIMVTEPIYLGIKKSSVKPLWLHVPSDGKRGGSKRVMKAFPVVPEWESTASIYILDEIITQPVLEEVLDAGGKFIGLLSLRVRNNGLHGRFDAEVVSFE